ncbi:MAG: hypothetical protein DLM73_10290 [Chthoniobacterales bacterium]|nr:MAG: hypothetical protein DLM73_10290 [Chthoniobacterales bacterium]
MSAVSPRPTIFISAVSKELRSARQLVANTLTFLGYEPIWQDIFGTETGDLRQMLRSQIDQSKGVVQLVGQCYGAEPPTPDPEFGRVSYTQYEALYARKKGIKVWYLFMDENFPIDPHEPEPEEVRQLQAAYRNVLKVDTHLFHPLKTREALEAGVLKLRDDLTQLRKGAKRWAWMIAALLVFVALLALWLVWGQGRMSTKIDKSQVTLEKIADRFEALSSNGGIIQNAKTPEEHYHNARIHELGGNFSAARKEYTNYLFSNLEAIDPWLSYLAMLKSAEGKAGAAEAMRYMADKLKPPTVSYQTAMALLEDGDARIAKLTKLAEANPDFGPLPWLISQEFSEARKGDQTLADQRAEKEWLEKFRAAHAAGKFEKYFLDKKESQKWIEAADARWAKLTSTPETVLENPVALTAQESNGGWSIIFTLSDFKAKELFYKLDGKGDFQSTGQLPYKNPQTGMPMINTNVPLPNLPPGEHTVEVKYTDKNGKTNGPYTLKFSTGDERLAQGKMILNMTAGSWLEFRDFQGKVILYFTHLISYRSVLKEIRYSLNSDALDKTFPFKPTDKTFEVGDEQLLIYVPPDTQFASVQVTFKDDTKSAVQKVLRKK